MTRYCDRLFTAGILFLILATPFAFGTVQPWAYTAMEVVIFGLVMVWMAKLVVTRRQRSEVGGQWGGSAEQGTEKIRNSKSEIRNCAVPLVLFLALALFQLLPLPPSWLKVISPQTFEVYRQSLPGWPERVPYRESDFEFRISNFGFLNPVSANGEMPQNLQSNTKSAIGNSPEQIRNPQSAIRNSQFGSLLPETWLPLSISAGLTKIDLLKFAAFVALFFLVWRYPFEEPFDNFEFRDSNFGFFVLSPEQRFLRSVVIAVLGTGLLVAAFGFVERFAWNGNILLFVAGYESGAPAANTVARAAGPFINPDHFANYLSLILPLALGCALFRTFMVPKSEQYGLRIFCGFTTFLLFTGILLSLSRGGWISALLGISILAWLSPWAGKRQGAGTGQRSEVRDRKVFRISDFGFRFSDLFRPKKSESRDHGARSGENPQSAIRNSKFARFARLSLITVCLLLIVSLFLAGSGGREQVDLRLSETIEQTDLGLGARVTVILKDIPKMIMDFPLFGVGLGAWPELFLRYRSGPWSTVFFREAHNDYLEILAETGFIGFGLLAGFFFVAGKRLVRGLKKSSSKYLPLIAGILAGLGGMALHEWLDFSLQIPANAFLFTVLLAVGLRLARGRRSEVGDQQIRNPQSAIRDSGPLLHALSSMQGVASRLTPYAGAAAAALMIVFAVTQDQSSYPHNFKELSSLAEAKELLPKHSTHSPYHLSVLRLAGASAPLEWQLSQAKAALWNEPANPFYRDFYAATLIAMGRTEEGLKEVARSVAESPSLSTHAYLSPDNLALLSGDEQAAVEEGFKQAFSRSYPEALTGLAEFYAKFERFSDQAALYEQAALKESDSAKKAGLLIEGGIAYLKAADKQGAGSKEQRAEKIRNSKSEIRNSKFKDAERLFRAAAALTPADPKPYQQLLAVAFAVDSDLSAAKHVIAKAIENNAPPLPLYLSLAEAAHKGANPEESKAALDSAKAEVDKLIKNGENPHALYVTLADGARRAGARDEESAALLRALERQPRSPETLMRLANVFLEKQNFDRAAMYLNRVAGITPNSADLFYRIAQAEEARYRYAAAGRAYARAIELAPGNASYRDRYEAFREGVEKNRVTSGEQGAGKNIANCALRISDCPTPVSEVQKTPGR